MSEDIMTRKILQCFEAISQIPRCSKDEKRIREWLLAWAEQHSLSARQDHAGNVLIQVPASSGYETAPTVVLQGHMDMVCEKEPDSPHDFTRDPLRLLYQGEWLTADKTTLGADNGIAIAIGLALALEKELPHPPLELLFTVDEETGLTGAQALAPGFITGKILLNLDSEGEGRFTVGCAGGQETVMVLPTADTEPAPDGQVYRLTVGKLKGGHSGTDILKEYANAIRLLARTLHQLQENLQVQLHAIRGGSADNAIPRDAYAIVVIAASDQEPAKAVIAAAQQNFRSEFKNSDPNLELSLIPYSDKVEKVMTAATSRKIVDLLLALPHGVAAMSGDIAGLVETSNNLATVATQKNEMRVLTSQRSSVATRLQELSSRIESIARLAGATVSSGNDYPSWQPDMASPLLARCREVYRNLFGTEPIVELIHAGLECGIIGTKYPGIDMVSFGPTIEAAHSPGERVHIPSITRVWKFLIELLATIH